MRQQWDSAEFERYELRDPVEAQRKADAALRKALQAEYGGKLEETDLDAELPDIYARIDAVIAPEDRGVGC